MSTPPVQFLPRPQGRLSYTVEGSGPLVVAVPGMGDLRSTYRELTGPLLDAGHRVAVLDLRGHGDSDTTFTEHGDVATGRDILALVERLGGPAVLLGNSMGASACAWAAAESPDLVAGAVLLSPLLRESSSSPLLRAAMHLVFRVALAQPWGARFWASYYRSLNKGTRAPWLEEHVAGIRASLREPGRLRSFRDLALQLDHSVVEPRLTEVTVPILAVIGALDPDYRDPVAEVTWIGTTLDAQTVLIPEVGHYPQHQRPDVVVPAMLTYLASLPRRAAGEGADGSSWVVAARG